MPNDAELTPEGREAPPAAASEDAAAAAFPVDEDEPDDFGTPAETAGEPGKRVVLENKFFNCFEEPYFRLTDLRGGPPVMVCKIGSDEMLLPFKGIMQECSITEDSADGQMLTSIAQSLRYVKAIRPGDPLPPELFSDGVSWQADARHIELAHKKLSGQLLAWIFEGDTDMSAIELFECMETDKAAKAKLNEGFDATAKQLGITENGREQVAKMIEDLASDIAFIEALREKFSAIEQIQRNLLTIQKQYGGEQSIFNLARSVAQLHFKAAKEFRKVFDEVDAQTGEIIAVLKNLAAQKRYIRKARNKLHTRLMPWDAIIEEWRGVQLRNAETVSLLLRTLYRFLAPRYMPVDEWAIQSAPSSGNDSLRWDEDDDVNASSIHAMTW
jgi:hypothetical protein